MPVSYPRLYIIAGKYKVTYGSVLAAIRAISIGGYGIGILFRFM
jgi:hypothetical protein